MATYDLTSKDTTGVFADSIAALPSAKNTNIVKNVEAYLDFDALVAAGGSYAANDIFQVLELPANTLIINAGAEVMAATDAGITVDIDFDGGDDIVDGGDTTSTGFLAAGTNGTSNTIRGTAASTYTEFLTSADTIDVKVLGAAPTTGRIRVYATVIDYNGHGLDDKPTDVDRDQLA